MKYLLFILVFLVSCTPAVQITPEAYPRVESFSAPVQPNPYPNPDVVVPFPDGTILLFPVFNSKPLLGTEVWEGTAHTAQTKPYIEELKPDFIKLPIYWSHVEKFDNVYLWPSNYDLDIAYLRSQNILPVLTVKMAPQWARTNDARLCGRPDSPSDYAEFAAEVAKRYPGEIAIEIWNEPDTPLGNADYYGCWGDQTALDYGGSFYLSVLQLAYPAIKQANPDAFVIAGALTLPCAGQCDMDKYIEAWADSPYYDAVSFHSYSIDSNTQKLTDSILYLRKFTDKPLWLTETAVISGICDANHEQESLAWAKAVKTFWQLSAVSWFDLQPSGWYCTDLLRSDWTKKPVYWEWKK